jgi:hypothetical protein
MAVARRWWLAAGGVVLFAIIAAGLVLAMGWVLLPVHTPGTTAVQLTVISRTGPVAGGSLEVLAATSVDDLRTLTFVAFGPNEDGCRPSGCWTSVTVDNPSLLIALSAPAPCRDSLLSADLGPGSLLTIHEAMGVWQCPPGAGTLAQGTYWLLAVPIQALPSKILTVDVDSTSPALVRPVGGEPLNAAVGSTTVDLRSPVPAPADRVTSTADLRAAVETARRDMQSRLPFNRTAFTGLALRRWPKSDLGCGTGANESDLAWGSLIVFRAETSTNVLGYEYHERAGRTVFCRETP